MNNNNSFKKLTLMIIGGSLISYMIYKRYKKSIKQQQQQPKEQQNQEQQNQQQEQQQNEQQSQQLQQAEQKNYPQFEAVNQHRKVLLEGCGVLNDMLECAFDINNEKIIICDKEHLIKKLGHMRKEGLSELQVVSDFDQTITAFGHPNEPELSSFGVIAKSKRISQNYLDKMDNLYKTYSPYEKDSTLDKAILHKYISEWYTKTAECFENEHMNKELLLEAIHDSQIELRYNFKDFINSAQHINLPYYIVSGGVSPIIQSCLESVVCTKRFSNLFLFCQEGKFDEQGVLTEMKMLVNTCSKYEKINKKDFQLRKNTLLFGDLHHDIYMKNELDSENVISIMFIRDKMLDQIPNLSQHWDIIITGNGSYIPHQAILNYIAGEEKYDNLEFQGNAKQLYYNHPIFEELRSILHPESFKQQ